MPSIKMQPIHKNNLSQHPARTKLEAMSRVAPGIWKSFERTRRDFAPALEQEYVGKEEANIAVVEALGEQKILRAYSAMTTSQFENMLTTFHTLATWRISQGVYRFDPDVYAGVIDSAIGCEIPGDLLLRLPERGIFVETPGLPFTFNSGAETSIHGVWARIESIADTDEQVLVLQPLLASESVDRFLHASRMPISGRIDRWDEMAIDNTINVHAMNGRAVNRDEVKQTLGRAQIWTRPVLNLLLYLCSENAEIGNHGRCPCNPVPKSTRRGAYYFPPRQPTRWDVGVRLGAALRGARQAASESSAGSMAQKRAHIRRAHWHGVRVGPAKRADGTPIPTSERRFELRWLPPIAVNIQSADDLPATIRAVN